SSLDGMYGDTKTAEQGQKKPLSPKDALRYSVLFLCIFGFLTAAYFVFGKLFDYYRSYVVYSGLQEMVEKKDRFAEEYLKKASSTLQILTPADILAGKTNEDESVSSTFSEEQETLVNKIAQLKKINPDTAGWITINGTVVNYPVVWSEVKNYYLRRDFYGKKLSSGTIYIDERNSPNITKNRNTVIYGHNMTDGSMFASIHDFASPTVFFGATIQIVTSEGVFIYKPFSVHESNAFDNYFETDFVSDEDFLYFCEQMAFISIFETNTQFSKDSQIITLSTCMDNQSESEQRFAVHAILTKVIR
ncbi:MAG: class B sortase, partial [Clostridia bacterium]|nr:class B sortase [Clostridia bacterium]